MTTAAGWWAFPTVFTAFMMALLLAWSVTKPPSTCATVPSDRTADSFVFATTVILILLGWAAFLIARFSPG